MVSRTDTPQNHAEAIIFHGIKATWLLWLVGGLYIAGPVIGVALAALSLLHYFTAPNLPTEKKLAAPSWPISLWFAGMAAMLLILWLGHINFNLGMAATIKSSIGWAKGWLLIALFLLAGAVLPIRLAVVARAITMLGKYTLWLLPVFLLAPIIGLPETLWVSPLKIVGGSGAEYFAATLYTREPGSNLARWQFFAPWSPAAGMIGLIFFFCALQEQDKKWRAIGIAAALALIILSQSRLALIGLALLGPLQALLGRLDRPVMWFLGASAFLILGWFAADIMEMAMALQSDFVKARADSSRVRATLGRIAIERWENEAFWFGHGIVERGPHLVEYMPIGSHHSWYGLLFVKGIAGLMALAIPMISSLILLLRHALFDAGARTGFILLLLLLMYSFGENLESLAYLYWPALILIGRALQTAAGPKARGAGS